MQQSTQSIQNPIAQAGLAALQAAYGVCNLIDEQGREVKITEAMILSAFASLKERCCKSVAA